MKILRLRLISNNFAWFLSCIGILNVVQLQGQDAAGGKSSKDSQSPPSWAQKAPVDALSENDRYKLYDSHFDPRPGTEVKITWEQVNQNFYEPFEKLRGYIKVSPPKGNCLIITRSAELPDERICKSTLMTFIAADIREDGTITWTVAADNHLLSVHLKWPTPHRWITFIKSSKHKDAPIEKGILHHCDLIKDQGQRRVDIYLMNKKHWVFKPPGEDSPWPVMDMPNLYIDSQVKNAAKKFMTIDFATGTVTERGEERITQWLSKDRYSFIAKPQTMIIDQVSTPGELGACRYQYNDQKVGTFGLIECQNIANYETLYIPLPCLNRD